MGNYYKLELTWHANSAVPQNIPQSPHDWFSGLSIDHTFSRPLIFTFAPGVMHHYYPVDIPLMSDELLESLRDLGVDNIQSYPAVINTEGSDAIYCHYKAVNVVGLADVTEIKEEIGDTLDFPVSSVYEIKEVSLKGLKLFRMPNSRVIIVDETVKNELEKKFFDLGFTPL